MSAGFRMRPRPFAASAVLAALVSACACGAPSRSTTTTPPPPPPPVAIPVVDGTTWTAVDGGEPLLLHFRAGGALHYQDLQGYWEDGTWTQAGADVTLTVGGGHAEYVGRITPGGDRMDGDARAVSGSTWTWTAAPGLLPAAPVVALAGTTWSGVEAEDQEVIAFHFLDGGRLAADTTDGLLDGTWELNGRLITIVLNDGTAEYFGSVSEDLQAMHGNARNQKGMRWKWFAFPPEAPPATRPSTEESSPAGRILPRHFVSPPRPCPPSGDSICWVHLSSAKQAPTKEPG